MAMKERDALSFSGWLALLIGLGSIAMVSNLLVVPCGERGTQPVVNAGTLY
jgi:hypothetical protein